MELAVLLEIAGNVVRRKLASENELLTLNEMAIINRTDIKHLAERLPLELGFEIHWYYYENRKRSNQELLDEVNEQIKEFETLYNSDFETEFGGISSIEADGRDDAMNYYDWIDLIKQKECLSELIKNERK